MKPTRLILADDHELLMEGLHALIKNEAHLKVIAKVTNGNDLLRQVAASPGPDLIILDINMPGKDGIELTREIKKCHPHIKILILTMYNRQEFVRKLLDVGADGYILKNSGKQMLLDAIDTINQGKRYFAAEILNEIPIEPNGKTILSDREKEVVQLISLGYSTQQIADQLSVSINTINSHRSHILSKIEGKNSVDIVKYGISSGIVKDFEL